MGLRRFLVILTIVIVIALIIAVWFFPSSEDFRVENNFWNGTGDISASYPALPLPSLSDLPPSPQGATLILIPYLDCTDMELEQLNSFANRGGRLILADDYGHGNQILEYLGLGVRFAGQTLLDPMVNYKNKQFPRITHLEPSPLTTNTTSLVFNHATCLVNVSTNDTLALSSAFSFLDLNDNGAQEEGEPIGPLAVISRHNLGSGQLILIADPSLFINSMEAIQGNGSFIQNIATTTSTGLYLDQSHLPSSELHETKSWLAQVRGLFINPLGASGLVILALVAALKPVWHKKKEDSKEA